jgi:hypothetical protein
MGFLLREKFFVDALKLFRNASDLLAGRFALLSIQLPGRHSRQPPLGAVHNGRHHFQIARQFGGWTGAGFHCLPLGFEEQLRCI